MERIEGELWAAMRVLTAKRMRVIYRHFYFGETVDEISFALKIPARTVERNLSAAKKEIEKYFSDAAVLGLRETLSLMKGKNGKAGRSSGQLSDQPINQKALACTERPAPSQNPAPDIYYESPEREDFLSALAECCSSAVRQVAVYEDDWMYLSAVQFRRDLIARAQQKESLTAKRAA